MFISMFYKIITKIQSKLTLFFNKNANSFRHNFLSGVNWLPTGFIRTQKLWQEGLYTDHLQKKVLDKFLRKITIYTNNLFSEGFVFKRVVDIYWTLITSPSFLKVVCPFNSPIFNFIWLISLLFSITLLLIIYGYIFCQYILTGEVL